MSYFRRHFLVLLFIIFTGIPLLIIFIVDKNALDLRVVEGGDFVLRTSQGPLTKKDLKGKTVLIFFGYLSCPDYCPTTMARISSAFKKLSYKEVSNVRALFISVDPNRDTPKLLTLYTNYFHQNIIGATANLSTIDKIVKEYGAQYKIKDKDNSGFYFIDHSVDILLMATSGEIAIKIKEDSSAEDIAKIIRRYL